MIQLYRGLFVQEMAGGPPDVPLLILTSTQVDPFKTVVSQGIPESLLHEEIEAKSRLYTDFAKSVPRGEVRPVEAGHVTIHLRGEQTVADAIADLVSGSRADENERRKPV